MLVVSARSAGGIHMLLRSGANRNSLFSESGPSVELNFLMRLSRGRALARPIVFAVIYEDLREIRGNIRTNFIHDRGTSMGGNIVVLELFRTGK